MGVQEYLKDQGDEFTRTQQVHGMPMNDGMDLIPLYGTISRCTAAANSNFTDKERQEHGTACGWNVFFDVLTFNPFGLIFKGFQAVTRGSKAAIKVATTATRAEAKVLEKGVEVVAKEERVAGKALHPAPLHNTSHVRGNLHSTIARVGAKTAVAAAAGLGVHEASKKWSHDTKHPTSPPKPTAPPPKPTLPPPPPPTIVSSAPTDVDGQTGLLLVYLGIPVVVGGGLYYYFRNRE